MKVCRSEDPRERALVLAPTGQDALLTCKLLERASISCNSCKDMAELCQQFEIGVGTALIAEEALCEDQFNKLIEALRSQPRWSDLPLIIFTGHKKNTDILLEKLATLANVTILQRPLGIATLVSVVRAALCARRRQYQIRELLDRLEEMNRQKDTFLAMLGHELRNPLSAISNAISTLQQFPNQDSRAVRLQEIINRQVRNVSRIVNDLLDVSRVISGKISLQCKQVNLIELADRSLQALREAGKTTNHSLEVLYDHEPVMVNGDPVRLEQVLTNLLDNAIKYTPAKGQIRLCVQREGREAVVRIKDNGIGISQNMLSSIFELFIQVEDSLDRSQGGLGLGLTLVNLLVQMHGGTVQAFSEGLGKGSEFVIRLPLYVEREMEQLERDPAQEKISRHILIVEDNPDSRDSLQIMLEMAGHRVITAENGWQAVELALKNRPEAALIDIGLPGIDGYQVAQRLRQSPEGRSIFLIALTGYGQREDQQRALAAGFNTHMVKPPDPEKLAALLAELKT